MNKKQNKERLQKSKQVGVRESSLNIPHFFDYILLSIAMILAFYIRGIIPHDAVFSHGLVAFAQDDAIYHMRIVENLVQNFPHKIWFEAFTQYPVGRIIHFGPLLSYTIAIISIVLGFGNPSLHLIQTVGAYYPVVIGTLLVLPTYVITRALFTRKAAIFASFLITVMPGQILNRSTLGFTDHHIGEVLFSSIFVMFLILALKHSKNAELTELINYRKPHKVIIYSIFSGIFFSFYMLQWTSGMFIGGVVAIFIVLQFILNHLKRQDNSKLTVISMVTYISAAPLILIFFRPSNGLAIMQYSWLHILITIGAAVSFCFLGTLSKELDKRKIEKIYYPVILFLMGFIGIIIVKFAIPELFNRLQTIVNVFSPPVGGQATIAEANAPTAAMIYNNYPALIGTISLYHISLTAMFALTLLLLYKWKPEKGLFLFWSITIYMLTTGQNRWFYYYSFNVAILSSFMLFFFIDLLNFKQFTINLKELKFKDKELHEFFSSKFNIMHILSIMLIICFVFLPNFNIAQQSTINGVVSNHMGHYEWIDSMKWMKENTPPTGLDFNAIYSPNNFTYPNTSYGVMSWWDYGHVITYYGHRIPNANPFQSGIGGGPDHVPGASTFFTAQTEEEAVSIANELGVKYVVSNAYMAYAINEVMAIWTGDVYNYRQPAVLSGTEQYIFGERWYSNMESRLHIFDTSGLSHFRLIYESNINPYTIGGNEEQRAKYLYNTVHSGNIPITNSGYVKIFEYVPGTTVVGTAPTNTKVELYFPFNTTMNNRTVVYSQSTIAENDSFSMTVPYSTESSTEILPLENYILVLDGNPVTTFAITEENIMNGDIIWI